MSRNESIDRERVNRLMMAALDGEIAADEHRELDAILERDPAIREEWERMKRVKEATGTMTFREPPEEVWDQYWTSVYSRAERGIGWILLSVGSVVVAAYAAWHLLASIWGDTELPVFMKFAIFSIALGLIVLALSVIREKLFTHRRDTYKEIQR